MVLMRVRRNDAEQPVAPFHDEGRIGHDHVDPDLTLWGLRLIFERNAKR